MAARTGTARTGVVMSKGGGCRRINKPTDGPGLPPMSTGTQKDNAMRSCKGNPTSKRFPGPVWNKVDTRLHRDGRTNESKNKVGRMKQLRKHVSGKYGKKFNSSINSSLNSLSEMEANPVYLEQLPIYTLCFSCASYSRILSRLTICLKTLTPHNRQCRSQKRSRSRNKTSLPGSKPISPRFQPFRIRLNK